MSNPLVLSRSLSLSASNCCFLAVAAAGQAEEMLRESESAEQVAAEKTRELRRQLAAMDAAHAEMMQR